MSPDFLDLLRALMAARARFLLVGGYAVAVHGRPRATKDLDLWVEASPANAGCVMAALRDFGAPLMDLRDDDFAQPGKGLQIGVRLAGSTSSPRCRGSASRRHGKAAWKARSAV